MARSPFDERCLRNPMAPGCPLSPQGGAAELFRSQAYSPAPTTATVAPQSYPAPPLPMAGATVVPSGIPFFPEPKTSVPHGPPPNPFQQGPLVGDGVSSPMAKGPNVYHPVPAYTPGPAVPPSVEAIMSQRGAAPITAGARPIRPPQGPPSMARPGSHRRGG